MCVIVFKMMLPPPSLLIQMIKRLAMSLISLKVQQTK